jgi:hypothetical protein
VVGLVQGGAGWSGEGRRYGALSREGWGERRRRSGKGRCSGGRSREGAVHGGGEKRLGNKFEGKNK